MKSIVLMPLLFVCFSAKAVATVLPATADTTISKTSLKKAALLKEFGNNDTCRALIEYWYSKRTTQGILSGIFGGAAAGGGLWFNAISKNDNVENGGLGGAVVTIGEVIASGFLILAGAVLFFVFFIPFLTSPRKKLLRILYDFRETGILPKKYLKKIKSRLQKNSK